MGICNHSQFKSSQYSHADGFDTRVLLWMAQRPSLVPESRAKERQEALVWVLCNHSQNQDLFSNH